MPLVALVIAVVLVGACDDPALDALPFACTDDDACGAGWRCAAAQCVPVALSPDPPRCPGVVNGAVGGPNCEAVLTAGGGTSCLTRVGTGNAHCWGNDSDGVASPRTGVWQVLAPGTFHGCGIDHQGLECWSGSSSERVAVPSVAAVGVAVGDDQSCAVDAAGAVVCWGLPGPVLGVPEGLRVTALAVGAAHACALEPGGAVRCWGYPDARIVAPAGTWSALAVVDAYSCALDGRGAVACWGFGVPLRPEVALRSIVVGAGFTCGLDFAGQIVCAGDIAAPPEGDYDALVAGRRHACAMVAGSFETRCWGDIVADPVAARFEAIDVEEGVVCGVTTTGAAHCVCLSGACGVEAPGGVFDPIVAMSPGAVCLSQEGWVRCWGNSAVVRAAQAHDAAPFDVGRNGLRELVATDAMVCASFGEAGTDCWDGSRQGIGFGARWDIISLASDGAGVCALAVGGALLCEGGMTAALPPPPARGTMRAVAIAGARACGRWDDGVGCWGDGFELSLPVGEVALGDAACVLANGTLICSDEADGDQGYRQVRMRGQTRCGILLNGDVACRVGARRVVIAAGSAE